MRTPGPWNVEDDDGTELHIRSVCASSPEDIPRFRSRAHFCEVEHTDCVAEIQLVGSEEEKAEAWENARFIASAPDLEAQLAALNANLAAVTRQRDEAVRLVNEVIRIADCEWFADAHALLAEIEGKGE